MSRRFGCDENGDWQYTLFNGTSVDMSVLMVHDEAMHDASVAELKANLAAYLQRVQDGEEFVITKRGRPVAMLTRPPAVVRAPQLGTLRGRIQFTPGWDAPMTDDEFEEFIGDHP